MNRCVWIILNKNFEMMLDGEIDENQLKDKNITKDADVTRELMAKNIELNLIKKELAKYLGERIIAPRK